MALWCSCEDSVSWNKREIVDMEDLVQVWQKVSNYETIIKVNDSVKRLVVEFQSDSTKVKTITVERKE
jgi:hypothetical protein